MYWSESELQLFLVHSRSLHWMQHDDPICHFMNGVSEVLLVLDNLLCSQVAILLLLLHVGKTPMMLVRQLNMLVAYRLYYMLEIPVPQEIHWRLCQSV